MKKMQSMTIIWGLMIFMIVGTLTFIGITYNKKLKMYNDFEKKLGSACEKYVTDNDLYPEENNKLKVDIKTLKEEKYIDELKVNKNKCKGYIIVEKTNLEYTYNVYIDCGKYKTEGFKWVDVLKFI